MITTLPKEESPADGAFVTSTAAASASAVSELAVFIVSLFIETSKQSEMSLEEVCSKEAKDMTVKDIEQIVGYPKSEIFKKLQGISRSSAAALKYHKPALPGKID